MLSAARHVRASASAAAGRRLPLCCCRHASRTSIAQGLAVDSDARGSRDDSSKQSKANFYVPPNDLARKLLATGVYYARAKKFGLRKAPDEKKKAGRPSTRDTIPMSSDEGSRIRGDSARINIVDDQLCTDVLDYMAPSLQRHKGCDIIDLYPGAGLFSTRLADLLQPRSHILMEPDAAVYRPFLQPLMDRPGTVFVPESGLVWSKLSRILTPEFLPHQVARPRDAAPERNDSLLVVANIHSYPNKKFGQFASLGNLLLYQFMQAISAGALFQKYGLVRMLIWCGIDSKRTLLPRTVQRRRRTAMDGEFSAEYIHEIATLDEGMNRADGIYCRDSHIDLAMAHRTLERMRAAGIAMPPARETELMRTVREMEAAGVPIPKPGENPARILRPHIDELAEMEKADHVSEDKAKAKKRLADLKSRQNWDARRTAEVHALLTERDAISQLRAGLAKRRADFEAAAGAEPKSKAAKKQLEDFATQEQELVTRELAWNDRVNELDRLLYDFFRLVRDNLRLVTQDPPVLHWDRREVEPLALHANEFFPTVPCSLLDVQPKAMHPLLREMGPGSSHAAEEFDQILSTLLRVGNSDPVEDGLRSIWHGAADGVMPNCSSLRDPARAGSGLAGLGSKNDALCPRALNEAQWIELLEAWLKWPFRPQYEQLVGASDSGEETSPEE